MPVFGSLRSITGAFFVVVVASMCLSGPVGAQDRGAPLFGPAVLPDTVEDGSYDWGRVWSFADPPLKYFGATYGVNADPRGLRHARQATVRLPNCSGAFVSPNGLVLTAARCLKSHSSAVRDSAFYAAERAEERPLDVYVEQVVDIEDVTSRVDSVADRRSVDGESVSSVSATDAVADNMEDRLEGERFVEIVREGGDRYVAYTYRRYTDVRLVFAPDPYVRLLGPIGELLTYPQHAWDVAFLRVYEDGEPLRENEFFEVGPQGARPGDAVFAVGYPETTRRTLTAEQVAFQRDVTVPDELSRAKVWHASYQAYVDTAMAPSGRARVHRDSGRLHVRRLRAIKDGLQNEYVMERLQVRDASIRRQASTDSAAGRLDDLFSRLADLQQTKRNHADAYRTFSFVNHPRYTSPTLRRALIAHEIQREGDDSSPPPMQRLQRIRSVPQPVDVALLSSHLESLREGLDADSVFRSVDPNEVIDESVFADSASAIAAVRDDQIPADDSAIEIVAAFADSYESFAETWSTLAERERALTDSLGMRGVAERSNSVRLPNGRAPRMADGRIQGYPYNGTLAPPFTTFFGLFARHHSLGADRALPAAWSDPDPEFDRSAPLTTAATLDLGAGAPGAPLLNSSLQLVGVVFDGNRQSVTGTYLFLPDRMRAVAVDVRGMLEGLRAVYGTQALVNEITPDGSSQ